MEREKEGGEEGEGRRSRREVEGIRAGESFNLVWREQIFDVHVRDRCFLLE